jgi:hypothetical protein
VKQDLQILIDSIDDDITGIRLHEEVPAALDRRAARFYGNLQGCCDEQLPATRRAKALELLQRYTGLYKGSTPLRSRRRTATPRSSATPRCSVR